eukprot:SAG22_NODE_1514_length_4253_cov_1.546943_5_plen_74_part_01
MHAAIGSRKEPGCLRFDVWQVEPDPETNPDNNVFQFHEVYKDADAVAFHRVQPHFALWTDFKAEGGARSAGPCS